MRFHVRGKNKGQRQKFNLQNMKAGMNGKTLKNGSYSLGMTAIVIAIVVIVNLLVAEIPSSARQIDVSEQKLYTISADTKKVLKDLDQKITIYRIAESGKEDEALTKLLERYGDASSNVKVKDIDPILYPNFTKEYTEEDLEDNSLIVEGEEKHKIVNYSSLYETEMDYYTYSYNTTGFDGEGQITSAVSYVISKETPVIYTLEGHGEQSLGDGITELIQKNNIDLKTLNLLTEEAVPEDTSCLVIDAPSTDLSKEETDKIISYLENGGKAMIFSDYTTKDMSNFDSILENYGVAREDGIVVEGDTQHYAANMPYYLVPTVESTNMTQEAAASGRYVLFPMAQGISKLENMRDTLTVEELLTTSEKAYSKTNVQSETLEKEDGDIDGPFALGVSVKETPKDGKETQLVYFSSSFAAQSQVDQMVSGGNSEFLMEVLNTMCQKEDAPTVSIPTKSLSVEYLTWTDYEASFWKICTMGLIPVVFLLAGFFVWYQRRKQ
jgi:ABC-2 type transport system permease protein